MFWKSFSPVAGMTAAKFIRRLVLPRCHENAHADLKYQEKVRRRPTERRPVQHIPRERERRPIARTLKRHPSSSFKRGISVVKRSRMGREGEIVGKPVMYNKRPAETEPRKVPRKAEGVKPAPKVVKASEASSKYKEGAAAPNTESTSDGHYELSPLLNKMLEAELQDIIKKICKLEPTNPKDKTERIVVNRFRNEAGDYLCNTIGLNVTKRLLNIHNPLYVKMVFAGKPLRKDLVAFLKQHNICAFKRVGEKGGTFAAKMRTFQDFDDLCTDKNLRCGNIRVTVSPCYQFTTCPPNLKTPFDPRGSNKNTQTVFRSTKNMTMEKEPNIQQKTDKSQKTTQKVSPNKPKEPLATANRTTDNNTKSTDNIAPVKATENKTENKIVQKVTPAKTSQPEGKDTTSKETNTKVEAKLPTKVTPAKAETKPTATAKVTATKPVENKDNKTPTNQNIAKDTTKTLQVKETDKNQSTVNPTNVASKDAIQKPTAVKQNTTAKVTPAKTNPTPVKSATAQAQNTAKKTVSAKTTTENKPNTPVTKNATTNKTPVAKTTTNIPKLKMPNKQPLAKKSKPTPKKKENDFDELDDHDILALLSGGIVLDECSGSDVD